MNSDFLPEQLYVPLPSSLPLAEHIPTEELYAHMQEMKRCHNEQSPQRVWSAIEVALATKNDAEAEELFAVAQCSIDAIDKDDCSDVSLFWRKEAALIESYLPLLRQRRFPEEWSARLEAKLEIAFTKDLPELIGDILEGDVRPVDRKNWLMQTTMLTVLGRTALHRHLQPFPASLREKGRRDVEPIDTTTHEMYMMVGRQKVPFRLVSRNRSRHNSETVTFLHVPGLIEGAANEVGFPIKGDPLEDLAGLLAQENNGRDDAHLGHLYDKIGKIILYHVNRHVTPR